MLLLLTDIARVDMYKVYRSIYYQVNNNPSVHLEVGLGNFGKTPCVFLENLAGLQCFSWLKKRASICNQPTSPNIWRIWEFADKYYITPPVCPRNPSRSFNGNIPIYLSILGNRVPVLCCACVVALGIIFSTIISFLCPKRPLWTLVFAVRYNQEHVTKSLIEKLHFIWD